MPTIAGAITRELEAMVLRGARRGVIDIGELVDCYVALAPASHPGLKDERRVDLDTVALALRRLPAEAHELAELDLVPRLADYEHEPLEAAGLAAGRLADGTIVLEARHGHSSIMGLVASLCALHAERLKARRLLATLTGDYADPRALRARVAITLGASEAALNEAEQLTGGAVTRWLISDTALARLRIHADLEPARLTARAARAGQAVVAALAEAGLLDRPLHLWIGPEVITDCVSPYARELRDPLLRWAASAPPGLGEDLVPLPDTLGEAVVYAVSHDLLRLDQHVSRERAEADRTVGITRRDGFEIVDLGRMEEALTDSRLNVSSPPADEPVLLRLAPRPEDTSGAAVREILNTLGARLASVTVVLEGTVLGAATGAVISPKLVVRWAGDERLTFPGNTGFDSDAQRGFGEVRADGGAVLSAPSAALVAADHIDALSRSLGLTALEVGGGGAVEALCDAVWGGKLAPGAHVTLALVGTESVSTGRSTLAAIDGAAAVAIGTLRTILGETPTRQPAPEPEPPPEPARSPRSGVASRFRIKA